MREPVGVVVERPLKPGELSFGFRSMYLVGADAALLQPKGGIDDQPGNPRFSHDFFELNVSTHLPVLTEGGVDVTAGRIRTIMGNTAAVAPYRPLYSYDYQFFYATDWHLDRRAHQLTREQTA